VRRRSSARSHRRALKDKSLRVGEEKGRSLSWIKSPKGNEWKKGGGRKLPPLWVFNNW